MTHKPLLSQKCDYCRLPFASVTPSARFCSSRCRIAYWKVERKREALADALIEHFRIAIGERSILLKAIGKAFEKFCQFAQWLGYKYHTKKYIWMKA